VSPPSAFSVHVYSVGIMFHCFTPCHCFYSGENSRFVYTSCMDAHRRSSLPTWPLLDVPWN
jgi:hypothetical protein